MVIGDVWLFAIYTIYVEKRERKGVEEEEKRLCALRQNPEGSTSFYTVGESCPTSQISTPYTYTAWANVRCMQ
jgi:hypothetical protein